MIHFFRMFVSVLLLTGALSCKSFTPLQKKGAKDGAEVSNWVIDIQLLVNSGDVTTVMSKISSIAPPLDVQVTENATDVIPAVTQVRVRYHAVTNNAIQMIRRQLETCPGVLSISIGSF